MLKVTDVLVPVDFSACSSKALKAALALCSPDGDLTLLHVIDENFVSDAVAAGLGTKDELHSRMREMAESEFSASLKDIETGEMEVEKMVVVGTPFVEILKIARDLDLKLIVMGTRGTSSPAEEILFGSTAEKVLRGSRLPVLCIPF